MRNVLLRVLIVAAVTAVGMFGADNAVGTWKLNVAKSTITIANPLKSRTEVYEVTSDGSVKITRTDQRADGSAQSYSYTFKYDGKEYPVTGDGRFDTISNKRADQNTTTFEVKKTGGKYHATGRYVISKDGKTRTQTTTGTDSDGKPYNGTYVYDKQ
jgi:glucose/arabinose dehydrogenase